MDLTNLVAPGTNAPVATVMQMARSTLTDTAHALVRRGRHPAISTHPTGLRTHTSTMTNVDSIALRTPLYDPAWPGATGIGPRNPWSARGIRQQVRC